METQPEEGDFYFADSLTDKEDAKIYLRMEDAAVKPLTTIFKTTNRHAFVQAVQKKMSEIGADGEGDLWKCKRKKDGNSFSILTQYNALTLSDVKRSQRNRISLNDHKLDSYSRWIFACLDDSITDTVRDSLAKYSKDINNDGPTFLFILLSTSSTQHKCKLEAAKRQIEDFDPESYSWDMEKIHLALIRIIGDYESCGVFAVDEENFGYTLLSKLTQSPSEAFNTKVAIRQESLRNKGETIYDILSQLGEDYRELVRQGIWNPDPQEGADIESHELHALRASHKLLIKKMKGQKRKVRAFLGKPSTIVTKVISKKEHNSKWMFVPPNTAGETKKSEKGVTLHWCGAYKKWLAHKPADCMHNNDPAKVKAYKALKPAARKAKHDSMQASTRLVANTAKTSGETLLGFFDSDESE